MSTATLSRSTAFHPRDTRWKVVEKRLLLGYEVDIHSQGRIWPKAFGNAMPEYLLEYPRKARARVRHDAREQTLADQSRSWLAAYVPDVWMRQMVQSYIAATYHGWRKHEVAEREHIEKSDLEKDVEAACRMIVAGLDRDGKAVLL